MAQLSTIISSILRDMIVAQHEANMYAVSLEEIYKKNGRLERFSLPSANIGEVEMELRYGVTDDSAKTEQYEINYPMLRQLSVEVSRKLARTALGSVLPVLQSAFATDTSEETEGMRRLVGDMATQNKFCAYLGRKILKSMQQAFTRLINEDGTVNSQELSALPDECVHSIKFRISPDNIRLFTDDM